MSFLTKFISLTPLAAIPLTVFLLYKIIKLSLVHLHVYCIPVLFCLYVFYEIYWKRKDLPAGPTPWLIAGNMPALITGGSLDQLLQKWKSQFGGVFTVWIGPFPLVMVCDIASIKKYFVQHAEYFSNRWRNYVTDTFMGGVNGIIQIDGAKWREQRRFALHVLRNFGVGRPLMEEKIMSDVHCFIQYLQQQQKDTRIQMHSPIAVCVGNIINNMLFGVRFPQGSSEMHFIHSQLDKQSRLVVHPIMGLYIAAPFTTKIPIINNRWNELMEIKNYLWSFLQKQVDEHRKNFNEGYRDEDDFAYTYMCEMEKRQSQGHDMGFFDEWQLTMLMLDLFFAGMETTVTTLKWAFLLVTMHPEVQRRVQQELDSCQGEYITLADKTKLLYTQATLNEIQRIANILPINLLRTTSESLCFDGFYFEQGTMVIPQISVLMNDEKVFPEPQKFKPERFLTPEGTLHRYEEFIPFSIGKRQCLGESLARAELFLIFSNLLKHFKFEAPEGRELSDNRIFGLTVSPPKYECKITNRKTDYNENVI